MADNKLLSKFNISIIKQELLFASYRMTERGLLQGAKWALEMASCLPPCTAEELSPVLNLHPDEAEYREYSLGKIYFDLKEYDRATYVLENCKTNKSYFLYMYARYMSGEKKCQDTSMESLVNKSMNTEYLKILRRELQQRHKESSLDGFCLYLYGVVLKRLEMRKEAQDILVQAVQAEPLLWSAWAELSLVVSDKQTIDSLPVPEHWIKYFWMAHAYLDVQVNQDALDMYNALMQAGFSNSTFIMAEMATALHNIRDIDQAYVTFQKLVKADPYRIDNMDTFSNILYVKGLRKDLAYLAHKCSDIDKYCVETCCIIGNYYSIRSQHEKSVFYFSRAIRLNPKYIAAWTLMGHEYLELKNTSAAIHSYRQALEANPKDFRAWYGLGQTYELLKMPQYCIYYYTKAQSLKPNDSRMLVALGVSYEKLHQLQLAKKCFWKAHSVGDIEGQALYKLGRLYEKLQEQENAAESYTEYICFVEKSGISNADEISLAYKYLANYHVANGSLDDAYAAAHRCLEFAETKEEGKALLKQISLLKASAAIANAPTFSQDLEMTPQTKINPNARFS